MMHLVLLLCVIVVVAHVVFMDAQAKLDQLAAQIKLCDDAYSNYCAAIANGPYHTPAGWS
jgi:hypothetical protein